MAKIVILNGLRMGGGDCLDLFPILFNCTGLRGVNRQILLVAKRCVVIGDFEVFGPLGGLTTKAG
jgi:hypothetical protein